jgi:hypothetical protein
MKKPLLLVQNVFSFSIPLIVLTIVGIALPTTPRASNSMLMGSIQKNHLLENTPSKRIIFVGGSNLSFGLNSEVIKDSLKLNPINTAIHGAIGIKFMLDSTLEHVKNGDIIVLIPEYEHYYRNLNRGSEELLRMALDVNPKNLDYLNIFQIVNVIQYLPKYALTKFKPKEYYNIHDSEIYSVSAYNLYGDTYVHWGMNPTAFLPHKLNGKNYNPEVLKYIVQFQDKINKKGAALYVSFPSFQDTSFKNSKIAIEKIRTELSKSNLNIIGTPERYKFDDSLMFNTHYHLTKMGVDIRTQLLIEDLKKMGID